MEKPKPAKPLSGRGEFLIRQKIVPIKGKSRRDSGNFRAKDVCEITIIHTRIAPTDSHGCVSDLELVPIDEVLKGRLHAVQTDSCMPIR
jgi:hypothetical protein